MRWQYRPKDRSGRMAHLQTELAELMKAIANATRWGMASVNPIGGTGLMVAEEILQEIWDVEETCGAAQSDLRAFLGPDRVQVLRIRWEERAFPSAQKSEAVVVGEALGMDTGEPRPPGPEDPDSAACGACYGSGRITEQGSDGVRHCMACDGVGFVKVSS